MLTQLFVFGVIGIQSYFHPWQIHFSSVARYLHIEATVSTLLSQTLDD